MTRIVNHVMNVLYPALVLGGVLLAWEASGQAELALGIPPLGDGFIPWTPTLSLHSSCDQKEGKAFLLGKSCSVKTQGGDAEQFSKNTQSTNQNQTN
jgi:hypothetical protein